MSVLPDTVRAEVVVVGAGPAGLAAAGALAGEGRSVLVLDEQAQAGGQVWRNAAQLLRGGGPLARSCADAGPALASVRQSGVTYAPGTTVIDASAELDGISVAWLAHRSGGRRHVVENAANALIIATGAQERAVAFPGAELPGVMGVGAVQTAMKQGALVPDGPGVVLAGQGPLLLLTLSQILALGGRVDAVLDWSPPGALRRALRELLGALAGDAALLAQGARLLASAHMRGRLYRHVSRLRAEGEDRIERVRFSSGGKAMVLPCTLLAVHDGVIPNTQFTRLLDLPHVWDDAQAAFRPVLDRFGRAGALPVWVAGDGGGIAGAKVASLRGRLAGLDAARVLGAGDVAGQCAALERAIRKRQPARRFVDAIYAPLPIDAHADETTQICRCEAVTLSQIRVAVRDGAHGPNRVKAFTRCGMGPCQGRVCGNLLTRAIAAETGMAADAVGALRIRPPLKPVLVRDYLDESTLMEAVR